MDTPGYDRAWEKEGGHDTCILHMENKKPFKTHVSVLHHLCVLYYWVFFLIFTVKLKNSIISLEKFCFKESKPTRGPWAILLTWETFLTLSLHEAMIWVLRKYKDNHLPFENEMVLYLKKTWIPFTKKWLEPSLIEIGPLNMEKKIKMSRVYEANHNTNKDENDNIQWTHFDQKSSLKPLVEVN